MIEMTLAFTPYITALGAFLVIATILEERGIL